MKFLRILLIVLSVPILAFAVIPVQFSDDFSTDTTGNYATEGSGSFVYDSINERACATMTGNAELKFSHGLSPASDTGTFIIDVKTLERTGTEGGIEVRLYDSVGNYYKVVNREGGSRTGGLTKYVDGRRVEAAWFAHKYQQGENYQIKISYSPSSTRVEAFGETLTISTDNSAIDVDSFTVRTKAQNACYDNILVEDEAAPPGNTPPVANAGSNQNVLTGGTVTLDGSGSDDADGDSLSYLWTMTSKPSGSSASLSDPTAEYPTFTADKDGNYEISLTVNDGTVNSAPDTVRISAVDDLAFFDDFSNDTTGDYTQGGSGTFTYDSANERACVTPTGAGKSFSHALSPASDRGTFVIDVSTLQRTGSEGEIELILYENSNTYYKIVNREGGSRTGGLTKYVNGTRVSSAWFNHKYAQGKNYRITVTYGPGATKVEAFGETLKINHSAAIEVNSFRVRTKAQKACYDNIAYTVETPSNTPPVADAGHDKSVVRGAFVMLDGSGSDDADGDSLSYLWTMTSKPSGSSASLSDPTAKKPSFTADKNGDYIISLVVNDGSADSAPDTVKVTTVGDIAFFDDFSNDTTGDYTQGGSGTFTYDSANERACVTPTGAGKSFSHDLSPASDTGTFSIDVSTLQRTGSEGEIEVRLYDNAGNYYKIINRSGKSRTGGLTKYVSGIRVSSAWFSHQYAQNSDYQIKVTYAPNTTKVEAFGETLIINNDHSPIEVSSFTVRMKAQKACYDNIVYTAETASPQGSITIDNAALKKFIASIYDNTPYNPPIDIQGVIDAGGMTVTVPYTVTTAPTTLEAYSTSVTLDASVTQDGESGIVATFAWAEQTNLPVGSGTFTATITIDDSAGNNDGIYKAKQLDVEDDSAGLVAATFSYPTDSVGATGVLTLKIVAGIPDRMFGLPDNNGDDTTHNFLYLPVTNATTGKIWLSNNLGANYANVNDPAFNLAQQATASNDYNAYGSLFQWGRKADGHELINWISGSEGTGVNGTTSTNSDDPSDALFITEGYSPYDWRVTQDNTLWANEASINNVCPVGYRLPTGGSGGELDLERQSWGSNNAAGALGSELKLPMPGIRYNSDGTVYDEGTIGYYWGSTVSGANAQYLGFSGSNASMYGTRRADGFAVRCIKTVTTATMLINDNFDNDTVGTLPPGWVIKYNGSGTANQKVVDTLSVSPNHSFQLEGVSSWAANIYKTPSAIPNQVTVEANVNIDASNGAYSGWFALYNKDVGTWGTQVGGLQFRAGQFSAYYAGGHYYTIQNFTTHQWYHVKIEYNIAARTYQVYIDGALATGVYNGVTYTTFPMHPSVSAAQLMLTAGNGGTVKVFFDDVKMYEDPAT